MTVFLAVLIGVMMFMDNILKIEGNEEETLKANCASFSTGMSVEEFNNHYWYKKELQKICRDYNISSKGTKADLKLRIERVLLGDFTHTNNYANISDIQLDISDNYMDLNIDENSEDYAKLKVTVINGFKFSSKWREFCGRVLKEKNFKFTKEMAAIVRKIKSENDEKFTIYDLLKVYKLGKKCNSVKKHAFDFMQPEEQTYQWNNFVRDFNQDSRSKSFKNKMKVAAILWKKVRDNHGIKKYRSSLIDEYIEEIKEF